MKLGTLSLLRQESPRNSSIGKGASVAWRSSRPWLHLGIQFASIVTVLALWPHMRSQASLLAWWLGLTASQMLLMGMSLSSAAPAPQPRHDDVPLRSYFSSAGLIIGGAAWGALALIGPYDASPQSRAILCVILCSVALAGSGFSRSLSGYLAFIATVLLPLFILLVASPPVPAPDAAFWLLAFTAFALIVRGLHTSRESPSQDTLAAAFDTSPMPHQAMVDNARAAIVLSRGNRVELCNRRFAEMMRVDEGRIAGSRLLDGFESHTDWHHHARAADAAIRRGSTYHGSTRLRRGDGSVFWAEITGQAIGPDIYPPQVVWVAFDVTERMKDNARDELLALQLRALIARSADWYWQTDPQHRLVHVTHEPVHADDTLKANLGRKWWQFHRRDGKARPDQSDVRAAFERSSGFRNLQVELPNGNNPPLWLSLCGTPRFNEHGAFLGHHGTAIDVTEQVRSAERIHHLAYHDALTGLPNRRLLTDRLTLAIARAQRYTERVGLLFVDLDDFRRINDLGGHAAGDQALLEIADRLRTCVRACDTVARLGSDEFVILLAELDEAGDANRVAAKVLATLHEPLAAHTTVHPVSTSIGVATFPEDAVSVEDLIKIADTRMYRAKRRGGQRIEGRDNAQPGVAVSRETQLV